MANGNPFLIDTGFASNVAPAVSGLINKAGQRSEQEAALTRQSEKQKQIQDTIASGDINRISQLMAANPQYAKAIEGAYNFQSDDSRKNAVNAGFRILRGEDPQSVLSERVQYIQSTGGDPTQTLEALNDSPEDLEKGARLLVAQYGTPAQIAAIGRQKGEITDYQREKLDLDKRSQDLRERELDARREGDSTKRKKLNNQLKLQKIKLDREERELAADLKGGAAKKLLRDSSEGARNAATFANRMITSNKQLDSLEKEIDPTSRVIGIVSGGSGITSEAANRIASAEEQQYASAASDFVTAQLRKESGAAIGEQEFERKYREFFPVPGDTPDQIEKKSIRRSIAAEDMSISSGGLYDALYLDVDKSNENQQAVPSTPALSPSALKYLGGQ